jgi:hypothetical protein
LRLQENSKSLRRCSASERRKESGPKIREVQKAKKSLMKMKKRIS